MVPSTTQKFSGGLLQALILVEHQYQASTECG
jgi:hypothetical protein